jgi:glycosyltransferase involved in cell wall biosynthesis
VDDAIIIMPAFNEASVIGDTLSELKQTATQVLVVDDGSDDDTAKVAKENGAEVLKLATNLNYGGALQAGFKYALRKTDAKYILTFDADGQHDPTYLEDILSPLRNDEADYTIGSRYLDGGPDEVSFTRDIGIKLFAKAASIALGFKVTDPTSGLIGMTREVAKVLSLPLYPQDYPDADVVIMLSRMGFRLQEVPVKMRVDQTGKSMHSGIIKPVFYIAKMTVSMLNLATRNDLAQIRKEAQIAA